jgi:hypothetical protein
LAKGLTAAGVGITSTTAIIGLYWNQLGQISSCQFMPKHVGELCHAEALFDRQASEQSLTRLRVCQHVSLDGKLCVRLN